MFELEDEKLGRLKVFNVSEARAQFASVLREKEAKVVITWHGRPFKILIDYQEYLEASKNLPSAASNPEKTESSLENSPPLQTLQPGQWNESDLAEIVKSITENIPLK